MTEDHARIDELLAGYALLSLDGADVAEADRLLADHVPECPHCQRTISDLQALAGDLALAAPAIAPPELVLPRIHREIDDVPLRGAPRRRGSLVALAASVVALVAMGGLSLVMAGRASEAEDQRATAVELLALMRSPGVDPVRVDPQGTTPADTGFVEVSDPDFRRLYLAGDGCPQPAPGHAYQVWLGDDGAFTRIGEPFVPNDGVVLLELTVDVARYDEIWISEERVGSDPRRPSDGGHSWRSPLPAPAT